MNLTHNVVYWSAVVEYDGRLEFHLQHEGKSEVVSGNDMNYATDMADFMHIPVICLN